MNALLEQFLLESREALEGISHTLLAMERDPDDSEQLGELFRLVHTLKGNSGLFDFPALTTLLHAAEDVMVALRNDQLDFSQALADELLEAADYVTQFLDEVEWHGAPGPDFSLAPALLVGKLRGWLADLSETASSVSAVTPTETQEGLPDGLPLPAIKQIRAALDAQQAVYWVEYVPSAESFFHGTDPLHLIRQLPDILWRKITPVSPWPALSTMDAYSCNLKLQVIVLSNEAALAELFRYAAEHVRWQLISVESLGADSLPEAADQALLVSPLALEIIRTQQAILVACAQQNWFSGQHQAALQTLQNVLKSEGQSEAVTALERCCVVAAEEASGAAVMQWLNEFLARAEVEPLVFVDEPQGTSNSAKPVAQWLNSMFEVAPSDAATGAGEPEVTAPAVPEVAAKKAEEPAPATAKVLKVEQEKIDRLMNLIGEIVVAKNGLPYLAQRAEEEYSQRELAREIKMQFGVINRIAEDLQDAIMQVRMMPVSFVLQRFPRLVRDIARKLDKKVALVIEGEETEADKAMIEALADPLVHVVRNSLDHGFETPDERVAVGKPEAGTLRILASQSGDHVTIVIADDGRGIDPQKIKSKVAAKGLVSDEQLANMSDQELVNLVFLPGFSTAESISDLSGRGVGMDVVRSAIEKVGGHLQLTSVKGQGTQLRLSLPLSMAVTKVMVIESGGQKYGVPMDQVMETVRLPLSAVHTVKHQPMTQLRGRTIALTSLNQMLAVPRAQRINDDQEHALMVLRVHGDLVGLLIDDFHGSVDIILKPMVGIIGELPGYAGTAVMGNGSILMILNPAELIA